jgi:hypothetical protein
LREDPIIVLAALGGGSAGHEPMMSLNSGASPGSLVSLHQNARQLTSASAIPPPNVTRSESIANKNTIHAHMIPALVGPICRSSAVSF